MPIAAFRVLWLAMKSAGLEFRQMLTAANPGMSEEYRGGPCQSVVQEQTRKARQSGLRPARIGVVRAPRRRLREHLLDFSGRPRVGEVRLVEFDVVAMLEGRHEFDTIERGKVLEIGGQRG
jgi:hypothetical protein